MSTVREWLTSAGFGWSRGIVIVHETGESSPGWGDAVSWDERAGIATMSWEPLVREFDSGFGGPQCPRFIAYDDRFVYFPSQYDGATAIVKVSLNPTFYVKSGDDGAPINPTPYPGG